MRFIKVYIHFVWSTKNRYPFLDTLQKRESVWNHIKDNNRKKGIFIDSINGFSDHCHCLVSLGIEQTIGNVMHQIKGESSHWINKQGICERKFAWQDDYYAASVGTNDLHPARQYIWDQEKHHTKKTFQQESVKFIRKFGLKKLPDPSW